MAGNPLMGLMQGNGAVPPAVQNMIGQNGRIFGPLGNMANFMKRLNEFKKTTNMSGAEAKQKIMQMRDAGQITDEQIEQAKNFVEMLGIQ